MAKNPILKNFDYRNIPIVAFFTYIIALISWIAILMRWLPMPGSVKGLHMTDPGAPEAMALSNGISGVFLYLFMWGVMMVAMMYPSSVPLFRMYSSTIQGTTNLEKVICVSTFMGTYTLLWTITGIIPLTVNLVLPIAVIANENIGLLLGGTFLLLSAYQLSPYKNQCLKYCRTPLSFLMKYHSTGVRGAGYMSIKFSIFCVGCCWALFTVMVIIGSMNILWMAIITIILSLERILKKGDILAKGIGLISGIGGSGLILTSIL